MQRYEMLTEAVEVMRDHGMEPVDATDLRTDGVLIRFDCVGDKRGKKNAWAVIFPDGDRPVVAFGHWARDIKAAKGLGNSRALNELEFEQARMAAAAAQRQRDRERAERAASARERASRIWSRSTPAPAAHPYLQRKRVKPHHARIDGLSLVIPLHDVDGMLHSIEYIRADGTKKFLKGGRVKACMSAFGAIEGTHILVCEGFATGATLREAMGLPVVAAMFANNLEQVALSLRGRLPNARLTLCADNDEAGVREAREAAQAVGGHVAIAPAEGTDWNDWIVANGDEALLEGLQ
jgi:putative DNA primase/helicase